MNSRELNGSPTYIFKTSECNLKIMLNMDRDNEHHFMGRQYAYYDGKENRVRNLTTLMLSTYHPILRKQLPLAIMECETEDHNSTKLFFDLINEALTEFKGEKYVFNPFQLVLDEKQCNWIAVEEVFGESFMERCCSCEFHYKQSINRRACQMAYFSKDTTQLKFKKLAKEMKL